MEARTKEGVSIALAFVEGIARAYGSLLFLPGSQAGFLIAALTWIDPVAASGGLLGVTLATAAALTFGFSRELVASGLYGIAPLLTGMAITGFRGLAPTTLAMAGAAALLAFLLATLLNDHLYRRYSLASMSLSFAAVATLLLYHAPLPWMGPFPLSLVRPFDPLDAFFASLGAIVFLPVPIAGALLLFVILTVSRTLAVLAVCGFAAGVALFRLMGGEDGAITTGMAGFNFMLTAMAVGGILLVPGPMATLHAAGAVAVTAVIALAAERLLAPSGLPVFAWPFNLATLCWIAVLSLRGPGAIPRLARPLAGTPESIAAQSALLDRLPASAGPDAFLPRLPVIGEWTITQAVDGEPTHRPPWQHAWDFEVLDDQGFPFRVSPTPARDHSRPTPGSLLADYLCFGAPVLAAADGTVCRAADGVHDNPPGQSNMAANYGNHVVLQHGPSLFSVYAHLRHGSVRVRIGETVPAGHLLGQCGASGRSPRPHLHFHVQAGPDIGSPTIPVAFTEYQSRSGAGARVGFHDHGVPQLHERVQSIATVQGARPAPPLAAGLRWEWTVRNKGRESIEHWTTDHELWGGIRVRATSEPSSRRDTASAVWSVGPRGRTATAWSGKLGSCLHAFFIATARVPAHLVPGLEWTDHPGADLLLPTWRRAADGLLLPFTGARTMRLRFTVHEAEGLLVLEAEGGGRVFRTHWDAHPQPVRLEVLRGRRLVIEARRTDA